MLIGTPYESNRGSSRDTYRRGPQLWTPSKVALVKLKIQASTRSHLRSPLRSYPDSYPSHAWLWLGGTLYLINLEIVVQLGGHVRGHRAGVAGVYNRARYQAEMRTALELWTEHLFWIVRQ